MRPYYDDGTCIIIHGDCREVLPGLTADVVITDPPYDDSSLAVLPYLLCHQTAAVFGYPELLVGWCVKLCVVPSEWVTWSITNAMANGSALLPRSSEHIAIFGLVPGARRILRPRTTAGQRLASTGAKAMRRHSLEVARDGDVWQAAAPGRGFNADTRLHPNEKPLHIMRRLVELCSDPSDLILDPFMGSGTTLRAAKDLDRRAIGIEIEERYCEIAARRLGQEVLNLAGTG
jgi:site-specific DNA-methyltransferase (adenine-specific)